MYVRIARQAIVPLLFALLCTVWPVAAQAQVAISEVMWPGSDLSTSDEWFELTTVPCLQSPCAFSGSLSLSGWSVTYLDSSGHEKLMMRFATGAWIGSGQYLIVANRHAGDSRLQEEPWLVTTAVSLPNAKLLLRLKNSAGLVIDEVDDGIGVPFGGTNTSALKASMERIDLTRAGNVKENWRTATTSRGFDDAAPLLGSPGFPTTAASPSPEQIPNPNPNANANLIRITEVMPDPIGSDSEEWIEIGNVSLQAQSLSGWSLSVLGSSKIFTFASADTLQPGLFMIIDKAQSGLSFSNNGATIILKDATGTERDRLSYDHASEGVSMGRLPDSGDAVQKLCEPTRGISNTLGSPDVQIWVQSGATQAVGKTTVNLAAFAMGSTTSGMSCEWNFDDGGHSSSCNPPPHSFKQPRRYLVSLEARNQCGTTVKQRLEIDVTLSTGSRFASDGQVAQCRPSTFNAIRINELLVNPVGNDQKHEWIELHNETNLPADLCGWFLSVGQKQIALDRYRILPAGYLVLSGSTLQTSFANSSGSLTLLAPIESLYGDFYKLAEPVRERHMIDQLTYSKAPSGQSYTWSSEAQAYGWTSIPTPREDNVFTHVPDVSIDQEVTIKSIIDSVTFDVLLHTRDTRVSTYQLVRVHLPHVRDPIVEEYSSNKLNMKFIIALLEDKKIELKNSTLNWDDHHRLLSEMYADSALISEQIVHSGLAMIDSKASEVSKGLIQAELQAIDAKSGIWSQLGGTDSLAQRTKFLALEQKESAEYTSIDSATVRAPYIFNEIYSHPKIDGKDEEWIELYNPTDVPLSLAGYVLRNSTKPSSRKYVLDSAALIAPHSYIVLPRSLSKLPLQDAGGTLLLLDAQGTTIDTITYPKLSKGTAYARAGRRWCTSVVVTKFHENICSSPSVKQKARVKAKAAKKSKKTAKNTIIPGPSGMQIAALSGQIVRLPASNSALQAFGSEHPLGIVGFIIGLSVLVLAGSACVQSRKVM